MGLLDTVPSRTRLYWTGLIVVAISSIVFFSSIWYSIYPIYDYYSANNQRDDARITKNLTNSVPVFVGSIVFIVIGTHMTLSGRKKS